MQRVIAIHQRPGFFERWLERCAELGIEAHAVNGYETSIMGTLKGCDALLWHLSQDSIRELEFGRSVLYAAATMGLHVFPNLSTAIHFDDKVAQKYLLEAIGAPLAPTWVFFSESEALAWADQASFPKVFKLRRGAGSTNVRLVRCREEAVRLIGMMFGKGMSPLAGAGAILKKSAAKTKGVSSIVSLLKKVPRAARAHLRAKTGFGRERGYVYFQEFIPENQFDIRVTVIGDRGFLFRRKVRPGDFRASGSGLIEYPTPEQNDLEAVRIAFDVSKKLGFQSMAYDFVIDPVSQAIYLLEISYVFNEKAIHDCPGHFDGTLTWHDGPVWPQDAILDDVLLSLGSRVID